MIESGSKINREKNLIDISQRDRFKTYSYEPKVREKRELIVSLLSC